MGGVRVPKTVDLDDQKPAPPSSERAPRFNEAAICGHCSNPFEAGKGVVTDQFALCDVCNGD